MAPVLGIDLGTTNSVVCVATGSEARVLPDREGNLLIPSVVSFHPSGDVLVGHSARERRLLDARNTIYSVKRLIGRPFRSPEVRRAQERFAFDLCEGPTQGVLVRARGETYTLPEISAFVLGEVRQIAEEQLGEPCTRAVITVPANFNELQRSATKAAGRVAGLEVLRVLNEPTAAALAYGYGKGSRERIAIFDLGGGTFDITLLELAGDVFEVLATAGDTFLGGDDIDLLVAEKMADAFLHHHRFDPRRDPQAFERLRAAAEWAKCQLSAETEVQLRVEELAYGDGGVSLDLSFGMTRTALEMLTRPLIARAFDVCEDAMRVAQVRPSQLDNVILVGGSTRIPMVRQMVAEYFAREPLGNLDPDLVVARGAALQAAALQPEPASSNSSKALAKVSLKRVTRGDVPPPSRRTELAEEVAAQRPVQPAFAPPKEQEPAPEERWVPSEPPPGLDFEDDAPWSAANAGDPHRQRTRPSTPAMPDVHAQRTRTAAPSYEQAAARQGRPPLDSPPPPKAVKTAAQVSVGHAPPPLPPPPPIPAVRAKPPPPPGATTLGGIPAVKFDVPSIPPAAPAVVRAPLLLDVTPHTLGVETVGGYCESVIVRNAAIPVEQTKIFTTGQDRQEAVSVRIYQGESRRLEENQELGQLELTGLRSCARGEVKIAVTFLMNADGTLGVEAKDLETGRHQRVRINLLGAVQEDEIARMQERQARLVGAS